MSNGATTPWNVLSSIISKKVNSMQEKAQTAKEQERQTEYKAWEGVLNNPASTEEERQSALDHMKKSVPKEAIPIVEGYHKVVNSFHRMRKGKQGGQGTQGTQPGGSQPSPVTGPGPNPAASSQETPNAAAQKPAAASGGLTLPQTLSNVNNRSREQTTGQEADIVRATTKAKREGAEETLKAIESRGLKVPDEVKAEILSQPTGAIPASVMRPTPKTAKPKKAATAIFGPGGQFRGVKDPEDPESDTPGKEYLSRAMIPPDRKDLLQMWDAGKAEEEKEQRAVTDKERRKESEMVRLMDDRLGKALAANDYKAARKMVNDADKEVQLAIDRQEGMDKAVEDVKKARENGKENQQAMLNIVANHIGMTTGAQPRMRMNKQQWEEAVQSAPVLARAAAHFDSQGYLSGVVLTDDQIAQMVELAHVKVGILKDHVDRVKQEHADELSLGQAVPPGMKRPKSKGASASAKSKEEEEDERFLQSVK